MEGIKRFRMCGEHSCYILRAYPFDCHGQLLQSGTDEEVARHVNTINAEGLFAGERKSALRIQPCSLDIDLIVLSFVVMEKKRRERTGDGMEALPHDEDPQGEGCVSGDAAGEA
jgi:hypothetical protein